MKKMTFLALSFLASGCATIHEKCTSDYSGYGSIDQCVYAKEMEEYEQRQALGRMLQGMGSGASNQTHCTTYYYGSMAQTTCK